MIAVSNIRYLVYQRMYSTDFKATHNINSTLNRSLILYILYNRPRRHPKAPQIINTTPQLYVLQQSHELILPPTNPGENQNCKGPISPFEHDIESVRYGAVALDGTAILDPVLGEERITGPITLPSCHRKAPSHSFFPSLHTGGMC